MMEVGKARIGERPDEVQRHGGMRMGAQHAPGIRFARFGGKRGVVDDVAPVAWKRYPIAGLRIGGAGLGMLAGKAAYPHDAGSDPKDQDEAHLKEHLQAIGDNLRTAFVEVLCAFAPLQDKTLPLRRFGNLFLECMDFPGCHERRQTVQLLQRFGQCVLVGVRGLLRSRPFPPGHRTPIGYSRGKGHVR